MTPTAKTTYWGTGNPVPMFDPEYRPGDNLYTNSSVALDTDTGKLKWYFQYTPGDYHDYDEVGPAAAGRHQDQWRGPQGSGALSAGTGSSTISTGPTASYIQSAQYVTKLNWTKGIDPKTGKPVEYDPTKSLQVYARRHARRAPVPKATVCPNIQGGINFFPTGLQPDARHRLRRRDRRLFRHVRSRLSAPKDVKPGQIFLGGAYVNDNGVQTGSVFAIDVATGKQIAKQHDAVPEVWRRDGDA